MIKPQLTLLNRNNAHNQLTFNDKTNNNII